MPLGWGNFWVPGVRNNVRPVGQIQAEDLKTLSAHRFLDVLWGKNINQWMADMGFCCLLLDTATTDLEATGSLK